jgi:PAS domain S-box-containing protein
MGEIQELNGALREAREELESLRKKCAELEERVRQRTQQVGALTQELKNEINERRQREKELEKARDSHMQERRRLEVILDTIPSGVVIIEKPDGRVSYMNPRGLELYGKKTIGPMLLPRHSSEFRLMKADGRLFPPEELPASRALLAGEVIRDEEIMIEHSDGRQIVVSAHASPLRNERGEITAAVGVFHDISTRKKAENEIKELNEKLRRRTAELEEANRELEAFTASVAHDLRTPLIVMGSYSQRLLKKYADRLDARGRGYIEQLLSTTRRMEQIIADLMKLSFVTRMEIKYDMVDLSSLAKSLREELQKTEPERQVDFSIEEDLRVKGDPQLLRVALHNLLHNAWKYTRRNSQARIELGVIQGGDQPVFFVRDNGCGFDMVHAERVFNPFTRLHKSEDFEGTGIGLATVKQVINRHGGRIWAESEVGQGTTFYFTI